VYSFLRGSHLARDVLAPKNRKREDLVQDRYSLRSAPQWIGPQLEDLLLADQQINIEINSSCDNPLIDSKSSDIYYGANFQAASVTSAMEKIRLVLQMFGKILFSQSFEMIDPNLSGGLPANLAADNPSLSFTMKGVDVNMAAYMAELAYLANPMSSHVQAAEMHNQSVNSMALASARMSADAVDILMKMCACHIYVVCQALDLRALHLGFVKKVTETINTLSQRLFLKDMTSQDFEALQDTLGAHIGPSWSSTGKLDLEARCQALVNSIVPILLDHIQGGIENVVNWKNEANNLVWNLWRDHFSAFIENPDTPTLLGRGSSALYDFVRDKLQVPFHQGFIEHPTYKEAQLNSRQKKTIGGWISIIHDSIDNGTLYDNLMIMLDNSSVSLINGKK
jgi:phenylalanine ammonia-lyase